MKLQRFFKMFCLVLAVTLFGCESDTLETDTPEQELVPSTLVFNRKSGSEMTQLLKKQGLSFLLEASNESGKGNKLYLGDVLETIDSLDNKNYSFNFNIENQKENEFYNLVLNKASDGIDAEPIVLKFISEESSLDSFVASSFDFYKFKGTIERYTLNSFLNSSSFTGKSGEPCDKIEIDNIDTVDDDAFSYGDATPPGGWDSGTQGDGGFTDDGCTMDLIVTHKPPGSNKTFVFGPDSVCQHNFTCEIVFTLVQDCNGPATNKSSGSDCPSVNGPVGINLVTLNDARITKLNLVFGLTEEEQRFLRKTENFLFSTQLFTLFENSDRSQDAINVTQLLLELEMAEVHYSELNTGFSSIVNKYNAFDIQAAHNPGITFWYTMKCAEIQAQNPTWNEWQVMWEASTEFIHITLDAVGLVPGAGEIADLINGAIYFAEGDSVNGTLSLSAAVPIYGWLSTGAKWAVNVTKLANGTKIGLAMIKRADGFIDFGKKSSKVFRDQLGLVVGDGMIGHHVIPWRWNDHPVVQAAANFSWHSHNASLNGKAVTYYRHSGGHTSYDRYVLNQLDGLKQYINDPERAAQELKKLSDRLQIIIDANPSKKINELF